MQEFNTRVTGVDGSPPHYSAVAIGAPVCDQVRSITTKPKTDHGTKPKWHSKLVDLMGSTVGP